MVNKLRHGITGLVVFTLLIGLIMTFYTGLDDVYDIPTPESQTRCGTNTTATIGSALQDIDVIKHVAWLENVFDPTKTGNVADLVGAIALAALGIPLLGIGIFTAPYDIARVLECYYNLPTGFLRVILILMCIYIAYIIISAKVQKDI